MTIATVDELENALDCWFSRYYSTKTDPLTTANQAIVGGFHSYWTRPDFPAAGAVPGATNVAYNHLSTGAINFMQQTSPRQSYLASLSASSTSPGTTLEIHDRLIARSGLDGRTTGAQATTGFDLSLFLATNNIGARIGDANYSDVQWWVEWYANTGGTTTNLTANVTYNDGTTGNLTAIALGATIRNTRMIPLNSSIPAADSGKFIRAINSISLSADTTNNGNFGVTATRYRASIYMPIQNKSYSSIWAETGLPEIYNQSCLFPVCIATGTTMGNIRIDGNIVHG
jgi:hypothetical protein